MALSKFLVLNMQFIANFKYMSVKKKKLSIKFRNMKEYFYFCRTKKSKLTN